MNRESNRRNWRRLGAALDWGAMASGMYGVMRARMLQNRREQESYGRGRDDGVDRAHDRQLSPVAAGSESEAGRIAIEVHDGNVCLPEASGKSRDGVGFALVVWDKEGHLRSSYNAARGPIRAPLVPTLAADALNRHIAIMLAAQRLGNDGQDDSG